jgi:protein-L-isoaspartate(D-aspartate) O-methyltransferase
MILELSPLMLKNKPHSSFRSSSTSILLVIFLLVTIVLPISESFENPPQSRAGRPTLLHYQTNGDTTNNNNNSGGIMKAWHCHGRNQRDLVDRLRQANIVQTPAVQKVMELVDRANYTPKNPYMDAPQTIGLGQTISAPHMHAHVLEEIYPYLVGKENIKLLDVGCGSGYLTAAFGRWMKPLKQDEDAILGKTALGGKVFGIDIRRDLVELTCRNIRTADADLFESGVLNIVVGDGWEGLRSEAPFDAIHVGAAAESMPHALVAQLKVGGVMIVPVGMQSEVQTLYKIERTSLNDPVSFDPKDYRITSLLAVRYVPLIKPHDSY